MEESGRLSQQDSDNPIQVSTLRVSFSTLQTITAEMTCNDLQDRQGDCGLQIISQYLIMSINEEIHTGGACTIVATLPCKQRVAGARPVASIVEFSI